MNMTKKIPSRAGPGLANFDRRVTATGAHRQSAWHALAIVALMAFAPGQLLAIVIDGNVNGLGEGYTSAFDVTFDIENGPMGVTGGKLFLNTSGTVLSVGLILPAKIVDNTYGGAQTNFASSTQATDWGTKDHFLIGGGGGKSLEGSDKWEIKQVLINGAQVASDIKLDYIDENGGNFNTRIERYKLDGTDPYPC